MLHLDWQTICGGRCRHLRDSERELLASCVAGFKAAAYAGNGACKRQWSKYGTKNSCGQEFHGSYDAGDGNATGHGGMR